MQLVHEFSTHGRLGRRGFWLRHLATIVPALWIVVSAGASPGAPYDLPFALVLVVLLVSLWGRRLHDRGRSAWWLLAVLVPVAGALALLVECGFRGTAPAADRFGPGPEGAHASLGATGVPGGSAARP